ncbi:MAG TPA: universal stress protein [Polyangia bacterium]|jgi:nucleotide-binding universal stress UspA family protein|nr:universal stress protein [Polyangia bacterium]
MKTILCAVDFSPASRETLACAASLARALGAELEIVHVVRPPTTLLTDLPPSLLVKDLEAAAERRLAQEAAALEAADVRVARAVQVGHAEDRIIARAGELGASLIIVGAHARAAGHRSFLGSVAERVVHGASCPVLVIPPGEHTLATWRPRERPLRITGAIDQSQASDSCLDLLRRLEARIPYDLHLVHLYWPPREHQRLGLDPPDPYEADREAVGAISRELQAHLRAHLGHERAKLRVRPWWGAGDSDLVWEAETDDADVLIVGNTQRRRGSTAIATIRTARLPVLCVPARLAREPVPAPTRLRNVMVTTDFSSVANAAIVEAYRLVLGGGVVTMVHVNEQPPMTLSPERKNEIETCLLALVPAGVDPNAVRTRVFVGEGPEPAEAIVQAAHRLAPDVVVISSHGRTGLQRALRGSVAEQVLRRSPKPVLVVPRAPAANER